MRAVRVDRRQVGVGAPRDRWYLEEGELLAVRRPGWHPRGAALRAVEDTLAVPAVRVRDVDAVAGRERDLPPVRRPDRMAAGWRVQPGESGPVGAHGVKRSATSG